ncbi:hypothetical protein C7974DRAFT_417488 [Boeremia exigua]|uniref:uncharacterized protein n=1 Tax=Boeremia exigua TaxID=749465 RepID=UPI001E8E4E23|nr:uncharacterized protein C7974DRAFT_417488 [Boeremia exigua]KAH6615309.1 hypothetical protein C7974DRAFT_417488 [Boeremia exigua]
MGNLCGKESKDAFDGPGRTLGSAPAPATKASVPATANSKSAKPVVGGPPRTLGDSNSSDKPQVAAGAAAEARANKTSTGGLQKNLDALKKQTDRNLLIAVSKKNQKEREADANTAIMRHD